MLDDTEKDAIARIENLRVEFETKDGALKGPRPSD